MIAYFTNVLVLVAVFAVLAGSLNILLGLGAMFSSAQAVFFGVGAYAAAQVSVHLTQNIVVAAIIAFAVAAAASIPLALVGLRIKGDYFVVASLGFQQLGSAVFAQWTSATGGSAGMSVTNAVTLGPTQPMATPNSALITGVVAVIIVFVLLRLLIHSPFGRALRALGSHETAARSLGRNVVGLRLVAVVLSGALAGLAGVVYAFYIGFLDPSSFDVSTSILIAAMVVLGGAGSLTGPILGALVLELLPAALNFFDVVPSNLVAPTQGLLYGCGLVAVAVWRPEGLMSLVTAAGNGVRWLASSVRGRTTRKRPTAAAQRPKEVSDVR